MTRGPKALSGFLGVVGGQCQTSIGKDEVLHPKVSREDLVSLDSLVQEREVRHSLRLSEVT